jgi:DNA end-binding protein Ku
MRAIWSGVLSFGLINIPVNLYSATAGTKISFNFLHKTDLSPIKYVKICRRDGKELSQADLVKGYEYQEGDYIVLTDDDLKKIDRKKTESIEVLDFVNEAEIDTIYFEKPYYLEPDRGAGKAYFLLLESLKKSKKVGIGKFVIHNREHLGVIKPHDDLLILEQMRFQDELQAAEKLRLPKHESFRAKELSVATSFIDHLTKHFDPDDYKDTYRAEVQKLIKEKAKGHPIKTKGEEPLPSPTKSTDLMILLKQSLEQAKTESSTVPA